MIPQLKRWWKRQSKHQAWDPEEPFEDDGAYADDED